MSRHRDRDPLARGRQQQQQQVPIFKETRHLVFLLNEVQAFPDGSRTVSFVLPQEGEIVAFPLNADGAKQLGEQLLAPSIAVAGAGDLPQGNGRPA